jgi:alkylated DNA repair dioxygenase AlkB
MAKNLKVGDRVWWTDPDDGLCSFAGVVSHINGEVHTIKANDGGGETECAANELKKLFKFSVDIQHTEEFTYQVDAPTVKDAEAVAMSRYQSGDDQGEHTEIVGDATITNSEKHLDDDAVIIANKGHTMTYASIDDAVAAFTTHTNKVFNATPSLSPMRVISTRKSEQWYHLHVQEYRVDPTNTRQPPEWKTTSIYCFVAADDVTNQTLGAVFSGSIYKPASYTKPARHSRGSVFDDATWGCAGRYGIASLR